MIQGFSWAESILCNLYFCHSRRFDFSFNCWKCQSVTVYLSNEHSGALIACTHHLCESPFVIYVAGCSIWLCASLRPPNEGTQGDLQITELQDRWLHGHISPQQSVSFFSHLNSRLKWNSVFLLLPYRYLFSRTSQRQSLWMACQVKDVSSPI